jgi:hypothetical protein
LPTIDHDFIELAASTPQFGHFAKYNLLPA